VIQQYFPATVELAAFSMAVALIIGIGVGVLSASRPGTIFDIWEGCLELLLMRFRSLGGMLMQLILLCSYVGSP